MISVIVIDAFLPRETEAHGKQIILTIVYVIVIVTWQQNISLTIFLCM